MKILSVFVKRMMRVAVVTMLPWYGRFVPGKLRDKVPLRLRAWGVKSLYSDTSDQDPFSIEILVAKAPDNVKVLINDANKAFSNGSWLDSKRLWGEVLDQLDIFQHEVLVGHARLHHSVAAWLENKEELFKLLENRKYSDSRVCVLPFGQRKRVAIFTAISSNYDSVKIPTVIDKDFDYFLFTDRPVADSGVWCVQPFTYISADATRTARFIKTHAHWLFPNYDLAIWVDSNITILGDLRPVIEGFVTSGMPIGAIPHPLRNSVYEEFNACKRKEKDEDSIMINQIDRYRRVKFEHNDLIESNFMLFDIGQTVTESVLNLWWCEIENGSKRDQLSLNYALAKCGAGWYRVMERPHSARTSSLFAFVGHDAGRGVAAELLSKLEFKHIDPYHRPSFSITKGSRLRSYDNQTVDIIVCVHNALKEVKRCLESILTARSNGSHRLIIVDDGSDTLTADYLREFALKHKSIAVLHRNEFAQGYTKAANIGLRLSTARMVILLNSDTVVTDSWAEKLMDAVFTTSGAGIAGPMSNAASHQSIPNHLGVEGQTAVNMLPPGYSAEDMNRLCELWSLADVLPRTPLVHGFCFAITREVINKIGFLDEKNFPRGYGEENDYCFRAQDAGFGLVVATHTFVYHEKSKSYTSSDRVELMRASSRALREKYSEHRVRTAVQSMQENPILVDLRSKAAKLYVQ